jgi:hypothetical protein
MKQDMVGVDDAVFRVYRAALHNREQVALHTLPANVGATAVARPGRCHFVNLVDENDTGIFGFTDGLLFTSSMSMSLAASSSSRIRRASAMVTLRFFPF